MARVGRPVSESRNYRALGQALVSTELAAALARCLAAAFKARLFESKRRSERGALAPFERGGVRVGPYVRAPGPSALHTRSLRSLNSQIG